MQSKYRHIVVVALLAVSFSPACDIADDPELLELADDELSDDERFEGELADHDRAESDQQDLDPIEDLNTELPGPSAAWEDCPQTASFCFWELPNFQGKRIDLAAGDFLLPFKPTIGSALKRKNTNRVRFYHANGGCTVFGKDGEYQHSGNLPPVKKAERLEPWQPGC